jgi:CHAT domain-containing protein
MSWRSAGFFALLLPLALIEGAWPLSCSHRDSSISVRAKLAKVLGPCRFIEGRVTGGFYYAPYDPLHPGLRLSKDRRIALRKFSREVSGSSPEMIANRALLKLLDGNPKQGVEELERAVAALPTSAVLFSDLSAAYLEDARASNDSYSRIKALDAAENALSLAPSLPEARFNKALALESLFLKNQARLAWGDYLKPGEISGWAREARSHGRALEGPDAASRWALQVQRLEAAALRNDQATVNQIVEHSPQAAREHAEEKLLGEWATAQLAKQSMEAQRKLTIARAIGRALVGANGERMVSAAVEAIDRATLSRERNHLASLETGHYLYQVGLQLYAEGKFTDARRSFARARVPLGRMESPFAHWAAFRLAVCEMQLFHYERALVLLNELGSLGFGSLAGRSFWVKGLIHGIEAHPAEAMVAYRSAQQEFIVIRENENLAVVRSLLAECLADWGGFSEVWKLHLDALRSIDDFRDIVRRQQVLEQAGAAALQAGKPAAALDLSKEALGTPFYASTAASLYCLRWKALAHSRLRQWEEAKNDLREARSVAMRYPDEATRRSLLGDLLAIEGEILAAENPAASFSQLNPAIKIYEKTGYSQPLALLYAARGRAYLALGQTAPAESDFQLAIEAIRAQQGRIADDALRSTYIDELRSIFESMIALQVKLGRSDLALDFVESARSQVLREMMSTVGERAQALLKSDEIQRSLPKGVAIIEYSVLPRELFAWVIRRDSLDFFRHEISPEQGRDIVASLRSGILTGSSVTRLKIDSHKVSVLLIDKLWPSISGARSLVFVPDRYLYEVPFAVLQQPSSGKFLVEKFSISTAPSVNIYLQALKREYAMEARTSPRALVVGDPEIDRSLLPSFPRLPYARSEAISVAALCSGSRIILGKQATLKSVLDGLRSFDVIHFSVHAVSSARDPLSSFLVLAPTASDSGLLYAHDIYKVKKAKTKIVVLSACSSLSGTGQRSGGELMSLAESFLASGVPAVIGSTWPIDDRKTRDLIIAVHKNLNSGEGGAEALRHAQSDAIARGDISSWAGFQLIGAGSRQ